MTGVRFGILGPIEVWAGDERLDVGGPRQLALLSTLLLHPNRAVTSDALITAVWGPDCSDGTKRLSMAIARLRRALEPAADGDSLVRTVGGGYLLRVPAGALDAERFESMVRQGVDAIDEGRLASAAHQLRVALDLWRGEALADVSFSEFAQSEIQRLDELRLVAIESRIDADLQLGATAGLVGELTTLVARHPTREQLVWQLMLALYRSGRQADALEAFQRTRTHLASELGVEPGPRLRALQAQILQHDPSLSEHGGAGPAVASLPPSGEVATMVVTSVECSLAPGELASTGRAVDRQLHDVLGRIWVRREALFVAERRDGELIAFSTAEAALGAAADAQAAIAQATWPGGASVRIRMGVHSGEVQVGQGGVEGEDVRQAGCLAAAVHWGQTLVSATAAGLAPDVELVDLGVHRLREIPAPQRLFGLGDGPHLLVQAEGSAPSRLPRFPGELIGRDVELAELVATVSAGVSRLVTVTGPGGSGKTRLAIAAAEALAPVLRGGAVFVALSQLRDPAEVAGAIAAPLRVALPGDGDPAAAIVNALSERDLLIVLDNLEHLLGASELVASLLAHAPGLRMIVTSQSPLRIRGERLLALGPLELPERDDPRSVATASASRLLIERARAADAGFELTEGNASSVARLTRSLGGLPLAIELAAARLTLLSTDELLTRLDEGIEALGRGPIDLPPRLRGLRAALDWTHGLLSEEEATLLRRMGVFAGAVPLERIERVCGPADVLGALARLVDLSLVTRSNDGRFVLHPGVRAYARERLGDAGEDELMADRHCEAYAEACERWGRRFLLGVREVQHAVLREEAEVAQALAHSQQGDDDAFARLAGGAALPLLWAARLPAWDEAIERSLARADGSGRWHPWLVLAAGLVAFQREDVQLARSRLADAIDAAASQEAWLRCLFGCCAVLFGVLLGAVDGIRAQHTELCDAVAELGDRDLVALAEGLEPYVLCYCEDQHEEAGKRWAELIAASGRTDFAASSAVYCWPDSELLAGNDGDALRGYATALRAALDGAHSTTVAYQLEGVAICLAHLGRHEEALEAAGWAATVRQSAGPAVNPWFKGLLTAALERSRSALDPELAAEAVASGRALSHDEAVRAALRLTAPLVE